MIVEIRETGRRIGHIRQHPCDDPPPALGFELFVREHMAIVHRETGGGALSEDTAFALSALRKIPSFLRGRPRATTSRIRGLR